MHYLPGHVQKLRLGELWTKLLEAEQRASAGERHHRREPSILPGLAALLKVCQLRCLLLTAAAIRSPAAAASATSAEGSSHPRHGGVHQAWQQLDAATAASLAAAAAGEGVSNLRRMSNQQASLKGLCSIVEATRSPLTLPVCLHYCCCVAVALPTRLFGCCQQAIRLHHCCTGR